MPNVCNVHQRMDKIYHTSAYVGAIRCGVNTPKITLFHVLVSIKSFKINKSTSNLFYLFYYYFLNLMIYINGKLLFRNFLKILTVLSENNNAGTIS